MIIHIKNKETLKVDLFEFKCSVGKNGLTKIKREGDMKTPKGIFSIGDLYYRRDRNFKIETKLKTVPILELSIKIFSPYNNNYLIILSYYI